MILLWNLYAVKIGIRLGDWFAAEIGSRQGNPISHLERVMETTECSTVTNGVHMHGLVINRYADDVDLLAEKEEELQSLVDQLHFSSKVCGLKVNTNKSKVMIFARRTNRHPTIRVDTNIIDYVSQYVYLGNLITSNND